MAIIKTSPTFQLTVLIPVRNEGVNIKIISKILHAIIEVPHEVLFVHDKPNDDCVAIVKNLAGLYPNTRTIYNETGVGIINALKVGAKASQGKYILIFAADEVGPALAIDDMLYLMDEGCDLVSCTRYAHGGRRLGGSKIGHFLSWLANKLFLHLSNSALSDCTTGIKIFRKSLLNEIQLEARPVGWAVAFELSIKAQLQGCKLGEVPIISIDRLFGGESTFELGPWFIEYLKWFVWGIKTIKLMREKKIRPAMVRLPNN